MIFVDSNVPMYLVGGTHSNKAQAQHVLEMLTTQRQRLVTDAEVLQEILHRYVAIDRRDAIQPAFDVILAVVDEVLPIEENAIGRAKQIVLGYRQLSARDAVHIAVMQQNGIEEIFSFDSGFDSYPGIKRVS